jgi:predicted small lipoprotein YifL
MQVGAKSAVAAALLLLAATLAGCGVKGPLEVPREAGAVESGNATPGTPGQPVAQKPFILDPLIR